MSAWESASNADPNNVDHHLAFSRALLRSNADDFILETAGEQCEIAIQLAEVQQKRLAAEHEAATARTSQIKDKKKRNKKQQEQLEQQLQNRQQCQLTMVSALTAKADILASRQLHDQAAQEYRQLSQSLKQYETHDAKTMVLSLNSKAKEQDAKEQAKETVHS